MDSLALSISSARSSVVDPTVSTPTSRQRSDLLVIEASLSSSSVVEMGYSNGVKALSLSAQKIVEKINEHLKAKLPNGVESLSPQDVTPEASAEVIVSGITALFPSFAKQNPELKGQELVRAFMDQARKGVEQGYGEAVDILKELGAFNFEGVEDGVKKTKSLIEEKFAAFESFMIKQLAGDQSQEQEPPPSTTNTEERVTPPQSIDTEA